MKNSWGQEISNGTLVYRGARLGNGSEYKLGEVVSIKDGKPRIKWLFRANTRWINVDGNLVSVPYVYEVNGGGLGTPSVEGLVVVDFDIEELRRQVSFHNSIDRDVRFRDKNEYEEALDSYVMPF